MQGRAAVWWCAAAILLMASVGALAATDSDWGSVVERATESIVYVLVDHGSGSGAIISPDGYILTAAHVVEGASEISVSMPQNPGFGVREARVVVFHPEYEGSYGEDLADVAVLKVEGSDLPWLAIGDSSQAKLLDEVCALGFPQADPVTPPGLGLTVALGVVQAHRTVEDFEYIHHSAEIDPGSSGGPLINSDGEIIGVNIWGVQPDYVLYRMAIASESFVAILPSDLVNLVRPEALAFLELGREFWSGLGSVSFSAIQNRLVVGSYEGEEAFVIDTARPDPSDWVLKSTLTSDGRMVLTAAASPDGKAVALGHADGTISLWDIGTGSETAELVGHSDWVREVVFSSKGTTLASASDDGTVRLWDTSLQTASRVLTGPSDWVLTVAFSPSGEAVAAGARDGEVVVWDVATGTPLWNAHVQSVVYSVRLSPDGRYVVSASQDGGVRLFDSKSGAELFAVTRAGAAAYCADFSPDSRLLATAYSDGYTILRSIGTERPLCYYRAPGDQVPLSVAFSPDGKVLVCPLDSGTLAVWAVTVSARPNPVSACADLSEGATAVLAGLPAETFTRAVYVAESLLASACEGDSAIKLWDISTQTAARVLTGHSGSVLTLATSPDGQWIVSGGRDASVRVWGVDGRSIAALYGHTQAVFCVAVSESGTLIASGAGDNTVRLWNTTSMTETRTLRGHSGPVYAVSFSPDGKTLASGSADKTIRLWDTATGTEIGVLRGSSRGVTSLAYCDDGRFLVSVSTDGSLRTWDTRTSEEVEWGVTIPGPVKRVAASHDGQLVAFVTDGGTFVSRMGCTAAPFALEIAGGLDASFSSDCSSIAVAAARAIHVVGLGGTR